MARARKELRSTLIMTKHNTTGNQLSPQTKVWVFRIALLLSLSSCICIFFPRSLLIILRIEMVSTVNYITSNGSDLNNLVSSTFQIVTEEMLAQKECLFFLRPHNQELTRSMNWLTFYLYLKKQMPWVRTLLFYHSSQDLDRNYCSNIYFWFLLFLKLRQLSRNHGL